MKTKVARCRKWWDTANAYVKYTILFLMICAIVYFPFVVLKKTLVWQDDGFLQWYPLLVKLKNVVRGVLQGNGLALWSWDTGLGSDWIGTHYIVFCDPFNYLAVFFDNKYIDVAYSIIVILKMYVAGMVVCAFFRYKKKETVISVLAALSYVFSAWAVISMRHDFFMTQIIIFPLLVLGIEKIWDKKSPVVFTLTVFYCVINSLYFSYMTAIFGGIYIVMKYILERKQKGIRDFIQLMFQYGVCAVVGGIFLAAPILIPSFQALRSTGKGAGVDVDFLPSLRQIIRFIPSLMGTVDAGSNDTTLGMSMFFVLFIPLIIVQCRKKILSSWMYVISLFIAFVPFLQSVMNGFSYASGRWCYIYCFFLIYAAIECIEQKDIAVMAKKKWVAIVDALMLAACIAAFLCSNMISAQELIIILLNVIIGGAAYYIYVNRGDISAVGKSKVTGVVWLNIIVVLLVFYSPYGGRMDIYLSQGKCYEIYQSSSIRAAKQIKDSSFYRIDSAESPNKAGENVTFTHTPANTNMYWGTPMLFEYMSTVDANWMLFNQLVGNNSGYYRRTCVYSNDNRSRLNYLLGVKYFLGDDSKKGYQLSQYAGESFSEEQSVDGVSVLKSKYEPSLGYVYDGIISESNWMQYSELEREQVLMQCAEIADRDMEKIHAVKEKTGQELKTSLQKGTVQLNAGDGITIQDHTISVQKENAKLQVLISGDITNSEVYLQFKNLSKSTDTMKRAFENSKDISEKLKMYANLIKYRQYGDFSIMLNSNGMTKRFVNAEGEPQAIRGIVDYTVNLGATQENVQTVECVFNTKGVYHFDDVEAVAVPQQDFEQQAAVLENNRMIVQDNANDHITGKISASAPGILYLNILYNEGWQISIDGKPISPQQYLQVNTAFMGVEIAAGEHQIELKYMPKYFGLAWTLFGVGVLSFVVYSIVYCKKKKKRR